MSRSSDPRPLVGVTGPDRGGLPAWLFTRHAVHRAGGRPLRITPSRPREECWGELAAVVIGGGADVGPADEPLPVRVEDDEARQPGFRSWLRQAAGYLLAPLVFLLRWLLRRRGRPIGIDLARDELELAVLAVADRRDLPVLGICRGAQLMNIREGGTLHRDLSTFYVETSTPWTVLPRKLIHVAPGTLRSALATERCTVNSLHRHAIDEPGADLRIVARDRAEVVQAIEHVDHRFWIGVQWHPEYLPQRPEQRRLFDGLVAAAHPATIAASPPGAAAVPRTPRVHEMSHGE